MKKIMLSIFMVIVFSLTSVIPFNSSYLYASENGSSKAPFTDIERHWAKQIIIEMANQGIFKDTIEKKFYPDRAITRGELCSMIFKACHLKLKTPEIYDVSKLYNDVKNTDEYASALFNLASRKIIDITGQFEAQKPVMR